jgi:hypothetical protein
MRKLVGWSLRTRDHLSAMIDESGAVSAADILREAESI